MPKCSGWRGDHDSGTDCIADKYPSRRLTLRNVITEVILIRERLKGSLCFPN